MGDSAAADEMLENSTFEGTYTGTATSWSTNVWNGAEATLTRETTRVHGGTSAQKLNVSSLGTNGGAILLQSLTTTPGQSYRASLWVRGEVGVRVQLQLRQKDQDYRTAACETLTFTDTEWHQLAGRGGFPSDTKTEFVIVPLTTGTVWLDDASLQPETLANGATDDPTTIATAQFFGIHYNKLGNYTGGVPAVTRPFGLVRLWDTGTRWSEIQPDDRDTFKWTRTDYVVNQAEAANPGATILMTLGMTPTWASARQTEKCVYTNKTTQLGSLGAAAEPADLNDWRLYVRAVATRYKGRIDAYEIWNEADFASAADYKGFWSGTMEKLLELAQIAYAEIRAADPAAKILTPNFTNGTGSSKLSNYLDLGGADYADILAFHVYPTDAPELHLPTYRSFLYLAARELPGKPVWNTEGSVKAADAVADPALARGYVARAALLQWAIGVRNFSWYCWDIQNLKNQLALSNSDFSATSDTGKAYLATQKWLVGSTVTTWETNSDGVWTLTLGLPGSYTGRILWRPEGAVTFSVPSTWGITRRRTLGGILAGQSATTLTVGPEPILLDNRPLVQSEVTALVLTGRSDTAITNGASAPSTTDGTDFGSAMINNATDALTQTFTLTNNETAALALTGTPRVQLSGTHASEFTLSGDDLPTSLGAGKSATFKLRFAPTATGTRTATVTIPCATPYTFAIAGTGTPSGPIADLDVTPLALTVVAGTTSVTARLPLANYGQSNLTWSATLPSRYTVVDSDATRGPVIDWVDLASSGTGGTKATFPSANTNDRDDQITAAINIGFTFPFMGVNRTQIRINTNGFLTFNTAYTDSPYDPKSLPTKNLSSHTLCPLWEDLFLTRVSGNVYYKLTAPDTFLVSWEGAAYFSQKDANMAFQVMLKRDGTITYQYNRYATQFATTRIGIQGVNTVANQAVNYTGATPFPVPLAVRFTPPPQALDSKNNFTPGFPASWTTLVTASGTVAPDATTYLTLTLDPSNLATGQTYRTTLTLTTNDTEAATLTVPVALTVAATETFETWYLAKFNTALGSGATATARTTADPDGDGLNNLLEYALGGSPADSSSAPAPTAQVATVNSKSVLSFTFTRSRSELTYVVQGSSDLKTWSTLATNPGTVGESVTVTDTVTLTADLKRFLRLKVTTP